MPGTTRCEWFKLFLEPHALRDERNIDPRLPHLPVSASEYSLETQVTYGFFFSLQHGKKAMDLIVDFLSCLWEYAKDQITRDIGAVADLSKFFILAPLAAHSTQFHA